jgi:uncharacterized protein
MLDPQYIPDVEETEESLPVEADEPVRPARRKASGKRVTSQRSPENEAAAELAARRRGTRLYRMAKWFSIRLAPLYSALYDAQMSIGKGVRLTEHRIQLPNFPAGAPPLRAAFLSDLHYGPTTGRTALRQAWKLIRDANPDVVLLGGDYLFADERGLPALLKELQRWQQSPPPGGIYACLGNHDYYAGRDTVETTLQACGVNVLVNDAVPLPTPWKGIWISGADDEWCGTPDLEKAFSRLSPDAAAILLAHNPDICDKPGLRRAGIALCGHTHGGQICLPGGDAPYIPGKHGKEYSAGLYRHAGQWLFVSRGVGTVGLPLRLFCPPEVTVFEFTGRASNRSNTRGSRAIPYVPGVTPVGRT